MMRRRLAAFFGGARIILPATLGVQALVMIRNVVVARVLGPEQFGIAVAFLLAQQFLDATTDTGLNKYLLRGSRGGRSATQAMVQLVSAARGVILAAIIVIMIWPIARLAGFDPGFLPFVILATIPAFQGFVHFDNTRQQRDGRFVNESLSNAGAEIACLCVTLALAVTLRSYIAVIAGLAARSAVIMIISHLMAKRRYQLRWMKLIRADLSRFALPLMANGLLLFLSQQGDRMLIAASLGLREVGVYAATQLLLGSPATLLQRVLGTRFMPRLARAETDPLERDREERAFAGFVILAYLLMTAGFIAVAPTAIRLLYGADYAQTPAVLALIAFIQGMRFLRGWPSIVGVAIGATKNVFMSNLIRFCCAIPLGMLGTTLLGGLTGLATGFLVGEVAALLIAQILLNRRRGLHLLHGMIELGTAAGLAAILPVILSAMPQNPASQAAASLTILGAILLMLRRFRPGLLPNDASALGW